MKNLLTIGGRELRSYFNSLTAYVVIGAFVLVMGLFFWFFGNTARLSGEATMHDLFRWAPLFLMVLTPLITMRSFAEESRSGTIELLATRPVTNLQIVIGKYFAANTLVILTLLPTLLYFLTLNSMALPTAFVDGATMTPGVPVDDAFLPLDRLDNGPILGAYIGLLGIGSIFIGIGTLASTLTDNVIVAFIIGIVLNLIFFLGFSGMAQIEMLDGVQKIGILHHYESIQRGVLDIRDVGYFLSFDVLLVVASLIVLTVRRK